jgi:thymidylate synthase (FAD)
MKIVKAGFEIKMHFDGPEMLKHVEWCGRTCYKSEENISAESAKLFVESRAIKSGHESMLEHCSATVRITCDLGISQEDTRHRLMHVDDDVIVDIEWNPAVSQESSRFCNYSKNKFNSEITFIDLAHHFKNPDSIQVWYEACKQSELNYMRLIELGESPQFARSVLIRSTKTEMVITTTLRQWRKYLQIRAEGIVGKPHPQMLEITVPLLAEFKRRIPVVFDDIKAIES